MGVLIAYSSKTKFDLDLSVLDRKFINQIIKRKKGALCSFLASFLLSCLLAVSFFFSYFYSCLDCFCSVKLQFLIIILFPGHVSDNFKGGFSGYPLFWFCWFFLFCEIPKMITGFLNFFFQVKGYILMSPLAFPQCLGKSVKIIVGFYGEGSER